MSHFWAVLTLLVWGLLVANLPFFLVFNRVITSGLKLLIVFLLGYVLFVGAGWLLENQIGQIHKQTWNFYVVIACLYLTFAFPGFVWRFLWKHSK